MTGDDLSISGMNSAVSGAVDGSVQPPDHMGGDQMALLPLRNTQAQADAEGSGSAGRGAGRPKGAKNKSTKEWTQFLLSRYASPLQVLAEMYSRPLPDLYRELMEHCGVADPDMSKMTYDRAVELLKIQLGAAKELAPYLHQKQPMAIDTQEAGLINLFIGTQHKGSVSTNEATNFDFEILDVESEKNQRLSGEQNKKFNGGQSNELPKTSGNKGNSNKKPTD